MLVGPEKESKQVCVCVCVPRIIHFFSHRSHIPIFKTRLYRHCHRSTGERKKKKGGRKSLSLQISLPPVREREEGREWQSRQDNKNVQCLLLYMKRIRNAGHSRKANLLKVDEETISPKKERRKILIFQRLISGGCECVSSLSPFISFVSRPSRKERQNCLKEKKSWGGSFVSMKLQQIH